MRTAVKLVYAGAAVSTVPLIIALAYSGDIQAYRITPAGSGAQLWSRISIIQARLPRQW